MRTNQEYLKEFVEFHQKATELSKITEIGYKVTRIADSYQEIFDRFCPFQIGDKVVLSKKIDFTKAPNWESSKHFLLEGAIAVVKDRDFRHKLFIFGIEFDQESWIDTRGHIHEYKPEERHLFHLDESFLLLARCHE